MFSGSAFFCINYFLTSYPYLGGNYVIAALIGSVFALCLEIRKDNIKRHSQSSTWYENSIICQIFIAIYRILVISIDWIRHGTGF